MLSAPRRARDLVGERLRIDGLCEVAVHSGRKAALSLSPVIACAAIA
jgi:hypothetical protein